MMAELSIQKRLLQLKKARDDLPEIMYNAAKEATIAAVEAATKATPPKERRGGFIGANTLSGQLKQHWASDSISIPKAEGNSYTTFLNNNMEYASYVNDGHRMDRHFVPGLHVNENTGLLEMDRDKDVGMVVGTKTKYVKGEFMTDRGKEAYEKTLKAILDEKIGEVLK